MVELVETAPVVEPVETAPVVELVETGLVVELAETRARTYDPGVMHSPPVRGSCATADDRSVSASSPA